MNDIQLPWSFFNIHGLEFNGQISFLKAGLYYADHITAVSPTYAREITEPQFAYGMEGLLQQRHREGRLSGVLKRRGRENLESRDGLTVGLALHPRYVGR
ncbi:glycogen synthase [Escherichia coli]|uniref:starch synthase n=1 Tax=Escherichia coli TaxID=562 RepID=A0A377DJZ1_ECOLX|nr:glycogen synthase [Escherichia coli]